MIQIHRIDMSAAQYKKHTHREHILEIPDTYIGSVDTNNDRRWVWDAETCRMVWKNVAFCPGFLKIVDEVLVNALDHRVRMLQTADAQQVSHIAVTLTPTRITVRNDGDGIPVDVHPETKIWAPELIFGNLLTSSNYDKSEEKITGGKNGYGSKLTNIFSTEFTVETVDHRQHKKYTQTWQNNMTVVGKPDVKKVNATAKPYTEISFVPDLSRFHWLESDITEIPADMLDIIATRVVDIAACAGKDCKVSLNGTVITTNTFAKYISLYLTDEDEGTTVKRIAFESAGKRWEIGAILTRDLHGDTAPDERHISFVNGIATRRGGRHVEYVTRQVLSSFCEIAKKKAKMDLTPALLKDSIVWFINATIVNPSFDTQTKETLTTTSSKFGSLPEISDKFIDQLIKIGLLDESAALLDAKIAKDTKKTDGKKKSVVRGIPKLDDATFAGSAKSADCTLILTEGDSAKTTAISGLKVIGREYYGVFPLRGKILNVKDIAADKKNSNVELKYIKQILGLESGKKYTDLKQLRYGRVMIMTDQDVDGSHIKGLLMNLFHTEWPELLKLGFLCCLMTPLIKVSKGREVISFYSQTEYEAWKAEHGEGRGWSVKYYKGLGTSTAEEAREYFSSLNLVNYVWDDASNNAIDLAFNKKRADDRKAWLATFDKSKCIEMKAGGITVDFTEFVNKELITFSNEDNIRSLPHMADGLKPSQRKILWAALKRGLTSDIKVAQLAGYVSEKAAYHHGETSLSGAIVGMAQDFVGSNNINLLVPSGQFGSRIMGGKDSAADRYIFTHLAPIINTIFKKEDDNILKYVDEDGDIVEPVHYLPIVPMLLINGALGIGTGFSSNILPYNPADIINALRFRLMGKLDDLSNIEMVPWWFGFKGQVLQSATDKRTWITKGIYEFNDETETVRITELPVGTWTQDYKEFLEKMIVGQDEAGKGGATTIKGKGSAPDKTIRCLKNFTYNYNDIDVDFTLELEPGYYHEARLYINEFENKFQLSSTFKTANMVAFDTNGHIRRYNGTGAILEEFYLSRMIGYEHRKDCELQRIKNNITELAARLKFVKAIVEGSLIVANAPDNELLKSLEDLDLPKLSDGSGLDGYEYLLRMRIDRIKASAVENLTEQLADAYQMYDTLNETSLEQLWLNDLDKFANAWDSYSTERTDKYTTKKTGVSVSAKMVKRKRVAKK